MQFCRTSSARNTICMDDIITGLENSRTVGSHISYTCNFSRLLAHTSCRFKPQSLNAVAWRMKRFFGSLCVLFICLERAKYVTKRNSTTHIHRPLPVRSLFAAAAMLAVFGCMCFGCNMLDGMRYCRCVKLHMNRINETLKL